MDNAYILAMFSYFCPFACAALQLMPYIAAGIAIEDQDASKLQDLAPLHHLDLALHHALSTPDPALTLHSC